MSLISLTDVSGVGICFRIHGDRLNTHPLSGPHDSAGDLTTIGDQDLLKESRIVQSSGVGVGTSWKERDSSRSVSCVDIN